MDIPNLKTFVAVAEHQSFSLAAESLFITQPAISKRVAALESELGLATSHHVGIHRLPPMLKKYTQKYPDVELDLKFMDSELACQDVANGTLELAVVTLPDETDDNLKTSLIWPDPLVIVTAPDHPLVKQRASAKKVLPQVLSEHPAVLPAVGTVTRKILFDAIRPFDIKLEIALETNYLEPIKMMVSVGLGWSALPSNMIDSTIVEVPIKDLHMQRKLGAVQLNNRTLGRAAQAFVTMLEDQET